MKKTYFLFCIQLISLAAFSQVPSKRILFLGNSYTSVNNLPQLLYDLAASGGDTIYFDSNAPGGYTLQGHSTNAESLGKIQQGNWDFVVLQEQSQLPSFPIEQVESETFPFAHALDSIIKQTNACAKTCFYMTWGRKNGDASNCAEWPPVCTYAGMDSLLNLRYTMMADSNQALLAPVGVVWKYLRANYPTIELYQSDESHPSYAGTYLTACTFYSILLRKDPSLLSYSYMLSATDAASIRNAVKLLVYNNLANWNVGLADPKTNFTQSLISAKVISFSNRSSNCESYKWYFGDGDSSTETSPTHTYLKGGDFQVKLLGTNCNYWDTSTKTVKISSTGMANSPLVKTELMIYPNPAQNSLYLKSNSKNEFKVQIYSVEGSLKLESITSSQKEISLRDLNAGLYFIRIETKEGELHNYRFLKEN
ncbi:MAG: hypothetical protein CFE21_00940 [Bacteroidetes bacterium B1(2017)]|nr:MAG: hypothetical protein CFE21_00940 [Bacteroidetes bacterium B1(2017)]